MRAILLVSVLSALISFSAPVAASVTSPKELVGARDPAAIKSTRDTPLNLERVRSQSSSRQGRRTHTNAKKPTKRQKSDTQPSKKAGGGDDRRRSVAAAKKEEEKRDPSHYQSGSSVEKDSNYVHSGRAVEGSKEKDVHHSDSSVEKDSHHLSGRAVEASKEKDAHHSDLAVEKDSNYHSDRVLKDLKEEVVHFDRALEKDAEDCQQHSARHIVKESNTRPSERSLVEEEAKKEEAIHENSRRSLEEQSIFGDSGKASDGQEWYYYDDDSCPEPLWACPVRGAHDADTFECVDLLSDLDSCGGCAAENTACVSLCFYP